MTGKLSTRILECIQTYPRKVDNFIEYGTAGFRTKANLLDHVMFRMGLVSALRSKVTKSSIGVMITASHNPEEDNGVKLVDPKGEMLELKWEILSSEIANTPDDNLPHVISNLIEKFKINLEDQSSVFIGQDTRVSSPRLAQAVLYGINCIGSGVVDFGVVSTPMLHYMIVCQNTSGAYGEATAEGYYSKLTKAFRNIMGTESYKGNYVPSVQVDGANGVGAMVIKEITKNLGDEVLKIQLFNDGTSGSLNYNCGADFVKVQQTGPENIAVSKGSRCVSLDGDADRVIYFYFDDTLKFQMLDGDKIALLFADHLGNLVKKSDLALKLGLVQTAYANGSSTAYAKNVLNIPVSFTPTGVKYLHHAALEYDIGVYFEANGHGTVVFSSRAIDLIHNAANSGENEAAHQLAGFLNLINSTVGDAVSDMLAVEAILHAKAWSIEDWNAMYTDLPNRQRKVQVADRTIIQTADAERVCVAPEGVQSGIDALVAKYNNGRSFVRPSGTEDIVRVYAEADTQENADALCKEVALIVYKLSSGVGPKP